MSPVQLGPILRYTPGRLEVILIASTRVNKELLLIPYAALSVPHPRLVTRRIRKRSLGSTRRVHADPLYININININITLIYAPQDRVVDQDLKRRIRREDKKAKREGRQRKKEKIRKILSATMESRLMRAPPLFGQNYS